MDYVWSKRVGEVEEEHSFVDLTIDEWLVIRGAFLKEDKEDSHAITPVKGFDNPRGNKATVWGGLG